MTLYGGIVVLMEHLKKVEQGEQARSGMPLTLKSPNAIEPTEAYAAFLISDLAGARRFAHAGMLRVDAGFSDKKLIEFPD